MVNLKNVFCALLLSGMLTACGADVVEQYITEIERTTKEIKAATTFEEVTAATERLMKWEREHYDALSEELDGDKLKQAEVNRAHKEFMHVGMSRSLELAKEKAVTE